MARACQADIEEPELFCKQLLLLMLLCLGIRFIIETFDTCSQHAPVVDSIRDKSKPASPELCCCQTRKWQKYQVELKPFRFVQGHDPNAFCVGLEPQVLGIVEAVGFGNATSEPIRLTCLAEHVRACGLRLLGDLQIVA
ncbi:MAG TPA: hypothetical protein VKB52_03985 [Rhodanobacteraceae bacterium]|nr:hypothetical protein [Rhodanobacteraceae bacterium]